MNSGDEPGSKSQSDLLSAINGNRRRSHTRDQLSYFLNSTTTNNRIIYTKNANSLTQTIRDEFYSTKICTSQVASNYAFLKHVKNA